MGYLMSKDGPKRTRPFRVKLKKLNKLTTIKATTITVLSIGGMPVFHDIVIEPLKNTEGFVEGREPLPESQGGFGGAQPSPTDRYKT